MKSSKNKRFGRSRLINLYDRREVKSAKWHHNLNTKQEKQENIAVL